MLSRLKFPANGFPLRWKIILVTCAIVALSTTSISMFYYTRTVQNTLETSVSNLAGETHLLAARFSAQYDHIKNDLSMVASHPALRDIASGNLDEQQASDSLVDLMTSLMLVRSEYTQFRLIGMTDNGKEIVRVNKVGDWIVPVQPAQLQEKGNEAYFQEAVTHAQEHDQFMPHERHSVVFSDATYNREHGRIVEPRTVMIRAILPIFKDSHELFGLLVINVDYEQLLASAFENLQQENRIYVVNQAGDFLSYTPDGAVSRLEFHDDYSAPLPTAVYRAIAFTADEGQILDTEDNSYLMRVHLNDTQPDNFLGVMLQTPKARILAKVKQTQRDSFLLMAIFVLIAAGITLVVSTSLTHSLQTLTRKVMASVDDGKPLDLVVTSQDEIGTLAKAFQTLTDKHVENESKLQSILANVGEGLIIIGEMGEIRIYNPACERIFGYLANEVIGQNVSMLMTKPDASVHDAVLLRYQQEKNRRIDWTGREETGRRKDGSTFPIELTVSEILVQGERLFVGIVRDITERKAVEKAKSEFVSVVNHELRTPLTSIKGALSLLRSGALGYDTPAAQKSLDIAFRNSQLLGRLINDILDIEKLNSGEAFTKMGSLDLTALVRESLESNGPYADEYNIRLSYAGETNPVYVNGDNDRLLQVLSNLLSNAIKFSHPGSEVIARVRCDAAKETVRVSIEDSGSGIPEDAQEKIFNWFTQIDSSDQRQKGGTGLGLAIVKSIVELHGGTIHCISNEDEGSIFYFELTTHKKSDRSADVTENAATHT
ncbi:ATP-binding protein [Thalassovita taeanensis]|uniref:histidine kinase n=1 Tax=Thalassovita taeanensis TaxID=657014 RepID=A0A1H9C3I5_9RHOB|nr:ATP-binding protein [Thalassovita taeanensis]SEP95790.1 PAS domain S-box-containing protein [Thalassovita taeanensis]